MDYKKLSLGLGIFSLALGAAELFAAKKIARKLDADGHEGVVKGFGAREVAAGVGILAAPAHSVNIWNRVVGDLMDLTALGLAARNAPRNKAIWGSLAFVAAALAVDILTARGLDEQTGKTAPNREEGGEPPAGTVVIGPVTGVVDSTDSAALAPELATA